MHRALTLIVSIGLAMSFSVAVSTPASANGNCASYSWAGGTGDGSADHPYLVASQLDLNEVRYCVDKVFKQTSDITLSGDWDPITDRPGGVSQFTGTYDGNEHSITGLAVTDSTAGSDWGLFKELGTGSVVKNLTFKDVAIDTKWDKVGALAGLATSATISNVHVLGSLASSAGDTSYHGGLLGSAHHATITDSSMSGTVYEPSDTVIGGLVGWDNASTIENCSFSGTVTGDLSTGGIAGIVDEGGTITDSKSQGDVYALGTYGRWAGGLVGSLDLGTITNSSSSAAITGTSGLGGLAGQFSHGELSTSHATGVVIGDGQLGGLIGQLNTTDSLTASGAAELKRVSATGDVIALYGPLHESLGGLVGEVLVQDASAWITQSYSSSKVTGDRHEGVGGLIGRVTFTGSSTLFHLDSAYSLGSVSGTGLIDAGGLIGNLGTHADTYVSQVYAATSVTQGTRAGGLVGAGTVEVSAGFWNPNASAPVTVSAAGIESTESEMKTVATYRAEGWDIANGWKAANADPAAASTAWGICDSVNSGYPYLLWQYETNPCVPGAPSDVAVVASDTSATVTWQAPSDSSAKNLTGYGYRLGATGEWVSTGSTATTFALTGLTPGTEYTVSVRARNAIGPGEASPAVSFTTKKSAQAITPAPVWPKTLKHPGRTVVFKKWLVTNAGQRVHPSARFSTLKGLRPSGDVRLGTYRVTKSGQFIVRVLTKKPVRVRVLLHSKATAGYAALNQTKVYRLR